MTRFLWPVTDDPFGMRPLATFFTDSDATDFVTANLGQTNLYICEPRRDRREAGYRPTERDWRSEYEAWLAEVDNRLTQVSGDPLRRRVA